MMLLIRHYWTKSIARQLMLGIALVHAVLMSIFVMDLVAREKAFLLDLSEKQAIGLAQTLAANGSSWMLSQDFIGLEEVINSQSGFPSLQYAMFVDTTGKVMGYTERHAVGQYLSDRISQTLLTAKAEVQILVNEVALIDIAAPILAMGKPIGWARVGISRQGIMANLTLVTRNGILYTLVAILIGTLFAWLMSYGLTLDIRRLVTRANQLQAGESGIDFSLHRQDELGQMADNFQALNETLEDKVTQRTRQLDEANNEIKRFAYIVSHDLRAPLVNIKGFSSELSYSAEILRTQLDNPTCEPKDAQIVHEILHEDIPEAIEFIQNSAQKMDGQINAILALSRLGSRKLHIQSIDTHALVKEQLSLLQHQLEAQHTTLTLADLPVILADKLSMEQIFANLLGNAVKYQRTEQPSTLHIHAHVEPHQVTFEVTDNGRGIAAQDIANVFDLFKRAGAQDTIGEGMGLAYVKTLVTLHGGSIDCTSVLGQGSTFRFSVAQQEVATHA